jgi:hypothetical protein
MAVPAWELPCGRCRASAKKLDQKGTAVPKDTHRTATTDHTQLELPEQVTVVRLPSLPVRGVQHGRRQRGHVAVER